MNLLLAADAGDLSLVRRYLSAGAVDVNKRYRCSQFNFLCTALHYACRSGHTDVVRALVEDYGADVNVRDCEDWTPVYYAANNGYRENSSEQSSNMAIMMMMMMVEILITIMTDRLLGRPTLEESDGRNSLYSVGAALVLIKSFFMADTKLLWSS